MPSCPNLETRFTEAFSRFHNALKWAIDLVPVTPHHTYLLKHRAATVGSRPPLLEASLNRRAAARTRLPHASIAFDGVEMADDASCMRKRIQL
jgi:hypothetical protein